MDNDMTYDGIFFINSAIDTTKTPDLSIFDVEKRLNQTLETLDSIDKYCPNNVKFIFDQSPADVNPDYLNEIVSRPNTVFVDMGKNEYVTSLSLRRERSLAETYAFIGFIDWFKTKNVSAKRIYKVSGRYTLNDNFVLDDPSYENAFVFANALDSWLPKEKQISAGVDKLYRLRCWHMDYNLLDTFRNALSQIFTDCLENGIDVEHSYYKNLHMNKVVEVETIGVNGIIGPSGEKIDE